MLLHRVSRSTLLVAFGVVLLVAGFLYPGTETTVVTALIVLGAGMVALGIVLPRIREFEVSLTGFRTTLAEDEPSPARFVAHAQRLNRLAHLACGDANHARELVEEALATTRERGVRGESQSAFALKTLIEILDTAEERRWLRGGETTITPSPTRTTPTLPAAVVAALQELDFQARIAFLLRADWNLSFEEIGEALAADEEAVRRAFDEAREFLQPRVKPRPETP